MGPQIGYKIDTGKVFVGEGSNLGGRCVHLMRAFDAGEKERVKYPRKGGQETKEGKKRVVRCRLLDGRYCQTCLSLISRYLARLFCVAY